LQVLDAFLILLFVKTSLVEQSDFWKYFSEIENALSKKCGRKVFLSPLDWGLIEAWQKRGVPLHIILKSIDSLDVTHNHNRKLNSLRYFREKIEEEFSFWLKQKAGRKDGPKLPVTDVPALEKNLEAYLEEKIRLLNLAIEVNNGQITKILRKAIKKLQNLKQSTELGFVEIELEKLEKEINKALLTSVDTKVLKRCNREVEKQMSKYKFRTDEKTYRRNCELMLLKLLRKEFNIPHLGLFDL